MGSILKANVCCSMMKTRRMKLARNAVRNRIKKKAKRESTSLMVQDWVMLKNIEHQLYIG